MGGGGAWKRRHWNLRWSSQVTKGVKGVPQWLVMTALMLVLVMGGGGKRGRKEGRNERGALSIQNEDPPPQDGRNRAI
eukprot:5629512-Pyramimonas_sp.AAC.1